MSWTYAGRDGDTSAEFRTGVIDVALERVDPGGTFHVVSDALAMNWIDSNTTDIDKAKRFALLVVEDTLRRALYDVKAAKVSP